jgi:hypothetical protein
MTLNRKQRRAQAAQGRQFCNDGVDPVIAEAMREHAAAIDAISEDDRNWFLNNPECNFRLRPVADAELAVRQCERPAENSGVAAYTIVRQIRPGYRVRLPFKTHTLHRPESFSDNACAVLLAELKNEYPEIVKGLDSAAAFDAAVFGGR